MALGFLSSSRNFCKLLWVSCEVLVLHGYAWIHWVAGSCTTTAYRWLFRDSQPSLRTLWSAVIKSPKFLHEVRLRQCVFCTEPLWFWSCGRSRNFGLSESECKHCAYPNLHFSQAQAIKMIHERTCVWVSVFRNSVIHKMFSEFLQIFWYFGMARVSPFLIGSSFLFGFGFLVGLVNSCSSEISEEHGSRRSCLSTCLLDAAAG